MAYLTLAFLGLMLFLAAEKSFLHFSRTSRRAFWYLLACTLGISLVRALQTIEGFGMVWVVLSAVLAASVVEDEVRKKTGLVTLEIDASKRLLAAYHSPEAQGKAERVMDIVTTVNKGQGYTAGTKQLLLRMSGHRHRLQRAAHAVLEDADERELNYILCAINAPALAEVASRQTMEMLTRRRLDELTTVARAVLVDALQKLGLRYRPQRQLWVKDVLLHTHGMELTHLKAYLDDGGDYHTMYKLAYNDLQGDTQAEVLKHLTREGRAVVAHFQAYCQQSHPLPPPPNRVINAGHAAGPSFSDWSSLMASAAVAPPPPPGVVLKVFSDVDDTLFSSGGSFPAGSDKRYPRKCFYPGALALYAELDRCFAKKYTGVLANAMAGVPPLSPRPTLDRSSSPCKSPLPEGEVDGLGGGALERQESCGSTAEVTSPAPALPLEDSDGEEGCVEGGSVGGGRSWEAPPATEDLVAARGGRELEGLDSPRGGAGAARMRRRRRRPSQSDDGEREGDRGVLRRVSGDTSVVGSPGGVSPFELHSPSRVPTLARRVNAELRVKGMHQEGSNLVFLSARPESYKGMTESEAWKKYFQPLVLRGQLDTAPTMLLGSLDSGPRALAAYLRGWQPPQDNPATATTALYQTLSVKKLSRAGEYAAIYPEACFVFVGDNGQGDVHCAEIMWSSMGGKRGGEGRSRLLACFIHQVVPLGSTYSKLRSSKGGPEEWRAAWEERDIYFCHSHVGMAAQALTLGLLDEEALHRVVTSAVADFRQIFARYNARPKGKHLTQALKDLNRDIIAANALLPPHLTVLPLPPPPPPRSHPPSHASERQHSESEGGVPVPPAPTQAALQAQQAQRRSREGPAAAAGSTGGGGGRGRQAPRLLRQHRLLSPARSEAAWSEASVANSTMTTEI